MSDIGELAGLPAHFLEEKPAPVNLKAYKSRRYRDTREEPTEPAEVVDFKTTGTARTVKQR
jgi:hypothetical protein